MQKVDTLKWILTGIVLPDDDFDSTKRSGRSRATGICIFYHFLYILQVLRCFLMFFDGFRWFQMVWEGFGRVWKGLEGFGRVWEGLGRVWEGLGRVGRGGEGA